MSTVGAVPGHVAELGRQFRYRRFSRFHEEIARLSEAALEPASYFRELLQRAQAGTSALAGAVWTRTADGQPQLEFQIGLNETGLVQPGADRDTHRQLLVEAFQASQPQALAPRSGTRIADTGPAAAGNPTGFAILLAPIVVESQVAGLVEIFQEPSSQPETQAVFVRFLVGMAHYASIYVRNHRLRGMAAQQQLWQRLEAFSRHVHASLDVDRVAYAVANEGRLLVECDRLSVAGRLYRRTEVQAISGVDVIEKRSNQVQLLAQLCDRVLTWGEKLVYCGEADEALPPAVFRALDAYLAVSTSKQLVVLPLRAEANTSAPPRFVLVMESFDPIAGPEDLVARLEVVGDHARRALTNATTYGRLPFRWLGQPVSRLQEALDGPTGVWSLVSALMVCALVGAMVCLPYPLTMEAAGQLLPAERRWLYSPVEGQVIRFEQGVRPGALVAENQALVLMYDTHLELKLVEVGNEIAGAQEDIAALAAQQTAAHTEAERLSSNAEKKQKEFARDRKLAELKALKERTYADDSRLGYFWLKSPLGGTVLNWDFREKLVNRSVKPSEPLLRIGDKSRGWEIELKIPQRHIGQVLEAFAAGTAEELDVDLLLASVPTRTFRGKLGRDQLAAEVVPDPNGAGSEPVVLARVRIDGPGIGLEDCVPADLLVTGTEIHGKIRCGDRRMFYALFYGVWEFIYEKTLFF